MSRPSPNVVPSNAKRGTVRGWTQQAARRHVAWLQSVDGDELQGVGVAFTLTVRDCPKDAAEWYDLRRAWERRMQRAGAVRGHWVTEWQSRGVPHLHGAIYFPEGEDEEQARGAMIRAWVQVTNSLRTSARGQDAKRIDDGPGWSRYCAKHPPGLPSTTNETGSLRVGRAPAASGVTGATGRPVRTPSGSLNVPSTNCAGC